jgi:hypothetical protein
MTIVVVAGCNMTSPATIDDIVKNGSSPSVKLDCLFILLLLNHAER